MRPQQLHLRHQQHLHLHVHQNDASVDEMTDNITIKELLKVNLFSIILYLDYKALWTMLYYIIK